MLVTGFTLAVLTSTGFLILYYKLPAGIKAFMCRHVFLTDAVACGLTYGLFGGTIVGLFAAAFVGLIVSVNLALVNNPETAKIIDYLATSAGKAKNKFIKWAADRVATQEANRPKLEVVK